MIDYHESIKLINSTFDIDLASKKIAMDVELIQKIGNLIDKHDISEKYWQRVNDITSQIYNIWYHGNTTRIIKSTDFGFARQSGRTTRMITMLVEDILGIKDVHPAKIDDRTLLYYVVHDNSANKRILDKIIKLLNWHRNDLKIEVKCGSKLFINDELKVIITSNVKSMYGHRPKCIFIDLI